MRFVSLFTLILLPLALPLAAVSGQDTVSPCTPEQSTVLSQAIANFIEGMPDQDESLAEISQWQREFWRDTLEDLPSCLDSLDVLSRMGRIADQVLIIKLASLAGEDELVSEYEQDTSNALMELQGLVGDSDGTQPATTGAGEIISFSVTPTTVDRDDTVTINWDVQGTDDVMIYIYHALQRFPGSETVQGQTLPSSGTITYTIPDLPITTIQFSPEWSHPSEHTVTVSVRCPYAFFVEPQSNPCPIDEVVTYPAAFQPFERGFMVWHAGSENVWFFADSGSGGAILDQWVEGDVTFDEPPPSGLFQPQHGFGKAWVDNQFLRDMLGWATSPEQAYNARVQATQSAWYGRDYYFSLPDERVVFLDGYFDTFSWMYLP